MARCCRPTAGRRHSLAAVCARWPRPGTGTAAFRGSDAGLSRAFAVPGRPCRGDSQRRGGRVTAGDHDKASAADRSWPLTSPRSSGGRRLPARRRSTPRPGRVETRARTPKATAVARPASAPSPARPNATAVVASRGPQPPTLSGRPMASRESTSSGTSAASPAWTPTAAAATASSPRCPSMAITESPRTAGPVRRVNSPARVLAASSVRVRRTRGIPARASSTATAIAVVVAIAGREWVRSVSRAWTGLGSISRIARAPAMTTVWPARRSRTTARTPRARSPARRP